MSESELAQRIVCNPEILGGKPVIHGTRLSVEFILNQVGHGATQDEILAEYKRLEPADISACLLFAAGAMESVCYLPLSTNAS